MYVTNGKNSGGFHQKQHKAISYLLIVSLIVTLVMPSWTLIQPDTVKAATINEIYPTHQNTEEIQDLLNLINSPKPLWNSPVVNKSAVKYQTIEGIQVLKELPEYQTTTGTGGEYLKVTASSTEIFSPQGTKEQSVTLTWEDSLADWISSQENDTVAAVNPPSGYATYIYIREIQNKEIFTIRGAKVNQQGTNTYTWTGKDITGNQVPDGIYEWYLQADSLNVSFIETVTSYEEQEDGSVAEITVEIPLEKTAPSYSPEYRLITLDQTAPEITAIHDLGNNKIGVETIDQVSGLEKLVAPNNHLMEKSPLAAIIPVSLTGQETITITIQDKAGNQTTETIAAYPDFAHTGSQSFYPQASGQIAGENIKINLYSGNGITSLQGFSQRGSGLDISTDLTYNHQNRQKGLLGLGFTLGFEYNMTIWPSDDITYYTPDGSKYWFNKTAAGYQTYLGGQAQAYPKLTKSQDGNYILTWENQTTFTFTADGRIIEEKDRNNNKNQYIYQEIPTYHGTDKILSKIIGSTGQEIQLIYSEETGDLQKITGPGRDIGTTREISFRYQNNQLTDFVDIMGAVTEFQYDSLYRLQTLTNPEGITTTWQYTAKNRIEKIFMTRSQDNIEENLKASYSSNQATIENPAGSYTLTWDIQGRLAEKKQTVQTETATEQAITKYSYDGNNLVSVTDPLGRTTEYLYNEHDQITASKSPTGNVQTFKYNSFNDLIEEKGAYGYHVEYSYAYNGTQITSKTTSEHISDPFGYSEPYTVTNKSYYDSKGLLDYTLDGKGQKTDYSYDQSGNLLKDGFYTAYSYDQAGNILTTTSYQGTTDQFTVKNYYNNRNQRIKTEQPNGLIEEWVYDNLTGLLEAYTQYDSANQANKLTTTYIYDDGQNILTTTTDTMKTTRILDGVGNTIKLIKEPKEATEEKLVYEYSYDSRGLLQQQTTPIGEVFQNHYNKAGQKVKQISTTIANPAEQIITVYQHDPATGSLTAIINPDQSKTEYLYDLRGRQVITKDYRTVTVPNIVPFTYLQQEPDILISATKYNSGGQIIEQLSPSGSWVRYSYDQNGQVAVETTGGLIPKWNNTELLQGEKDSIYPEHEILQTRSYEYDPQGRLSKATDGEGYTTEYAYNGLSVSTTEQAFDQNRNLTTYTTTSVYDSMGNLTKQISPLQNAEEFIYDVFGKIKKRVNPEGKTVEYFYDNKQRLAQTKEDVAINNGIKETQTINFAYDEWGYQKEVKKQIEADNYAIYSYQYSPTGLLQKATFPEGKIVEYLYDSHGRLQKEITSNQKSQTTETTTVEYLYDLLGRKYQTNWADNTTSYTIFDSVGNAVISIDEEGKVGRFYYTEDGKIKAFEQYGQVTSFNQPSITRSVFLYDGIGNKRLVQDANANLKVYLYDKEGRQIEERFAGKELGGALETNKKEYDPRGLVTAIIDGEDNRIEIYHDGEGRITKEIDAENIWSTYEYSPAGFLEAIRRPLGRDTEFAYNLRGQKTKEIDAENYQYIFDYNRAGFLTGETNKRGDYIRYQSNNEGQITTKYTPSEGIYSYSYDSVGNMLAKTEPVYGTTYFTYTAIGLLEQVNQPSDDGRRLITKYSYTKSGNLKSQTDPNNQITEYAYDYSNRKTKETTYLNGIAYTFEYRYDGLGNLIYEKQPGGGYVTREFDQKNRLMQEISSDGKYAYFTYYKNDLLKTETTQAGTINYTYFANGQLKAVSYPNGDQNQYVYDSNGDLYQEIVNGQPRTYDRDDKGLTATFTDSLGYQYTYQYNPEGVVEHIELPNGVTTDLTFKPGMLPDNITTKGANGEQLYTNSYDHNKRDYVTAVNENGRNSSFEYEARGQLYQIATPERDIRLYTYDDAGNRTSRLAIIGGAETTSGKMEYSSLEFIDIETLLEMILEKLPEEESEEAEKQEKQPNENNGKNDKNQLNQQSLLIDQSIANRLNNLLAHQTTNEILLLAKGGNSDNNGNSGNNGSNQNKDQNGEKGQQNALERGNGKKLGLLKKLGILEDEKKTGQVENILAVLDQIVNGEMNLPPGEHEDLFALIREVGKGYAVIGTTWQYNSKNEVATRENHIRLEEYDYAHDDAGNMTTDGRSEYIWNPKGQLEQVTSPDGSGQKYLYDARGRRTKTIQFNHQENSQWEINYHYKGDSWNIDRETDESGNTIMEFTYDERNKPLSITFQGETFWYIYNGHGDVVALTDLNGQIAVRYEYDEWGLPTKMYNRFGERVREGIGWIGDLGTGNGTPGSRMEETDNEEIDQHPGNGNSNGNANGKDKAKEEEENVEAASQEAAGTTADNGEVNSEEVIAEETTTEEETTEEQPAVEDEPTADITTELVKENPYRYSHYYFDRKTQNYYLQARYYNPRLGRFISLDPLRGDITNPLSLNRYVYGLNNPVNYVDPTGFYSIEMTGNNEAGNLDYGNGFVTLLGIDFPIYAPPYINGANNNYNDSGWITVDNKSFGPYRVTNWGMFIAQLSGAYLEDNQPIKVNQNNEVDLNGSKSGRVNTLNSPSQKGIGIGALILAAGEGLNAYQNSTIDFWVTLNIQERGDLSRAVIQLESSNNSFTKMAGTSRYFLEGTLHEPMRYWAEAGIYNHFSEMGYNVSDHHPNLYFSFDKDHAIDLSLGYIRINRTGDFLITRKLYDGDRFELGHHTEFLGFNTGFVVDYDLTNLWRRTFILDEAFQTIVDGAIAGELTFKK